MKDGTKRLVGLQVVPSGWRRVDAANQGEDAGDLSSLRDDELFYIQPVIALGLVETWWKHCEPFERDIDPAGPPVVWNTNIDQSIVAIGSHCDLWLDWDEQGTFLELLAPGEEPNIERLRATAIRQIESSRRQAKRAEAA